MNAAVERVRDASDDLGAVRDRVLLRDPLPLACGRTLSDVEIGFESYGRPNAARDNAVLVLHGLTADRHAAGPPLAPGGKKGWWDAVIGPGKAIDTDRYFVLAPDALGGGGASTGPAFVEPGTARPWAMRFPLVTIADMVDAQCAMADALGIRRFALVVGGCMGGFQVLEWMARHPERLARAISIGATPKTSAHNLALWSVMRQAIRTDPAWRGGDYYGRVGPDAGIALLAMFGAVFWMSREVFESRFGLKSAAEGGPAFSFAPEFEVERFLDQIGRGAAGKLDANALMYLTRAIDYFDMTRGRRSLADAFRGYRGQALLVSYENDWRYPPAEIEVLNAALREAGADCRHETLSSAYGHGAFLFDPPAVSALIVDALAR
jgi:homoserine O-acetyltransferase